MLLLTLSLTSYSQIESKDCGWVYKSTQNVTYYTDNRPKNHRTGNIELYYNQTCENYLRICYVDGSNEFYYPVSENSIQSSETKGGYPYNLYRLKDFQTNKSVLLQIIYSNPTVIRLHYGDGYVEFY